MRGGAERIRASERPAQSGHWGSVWIDADKRRPFKVEGAADIRPRRRWLGLL